MHFISRFLTASLLKLSLSALIMSSTVLYLVGNPVLLKTSLKEANVYQDIVPAVFETIETDLNTNQLSPGQQKDTMFADPAVREVVRNSVEPNVLQTQVDGAIDAFSGWLYGDLETLNFVMNFNPIKETLTRNLSNYAVTRTESLPVCSATNIKAAANYDVLSLQCRPEGITASDAEQKIRSELADIDFMVTEQTFQKDGDQPLASNLSELKNAFSLLKMIVLVSLVVTALSIGAYLLAHRPFKQALYGLGKSLLGSGLMVLVPAGLAILIVPKILSRVSDGQKALAEVGLSFASEYATKVCLVLLFWGGILSVVGIVVMIIDRKVITKHERSRS